jgi:hypothetical protein
MKLALTSILSIALLGAVASAARADDAAAIAAADAWWTDVADWGTPAASKKAPLVYATRTTTRECKKLKVGKATSEKAAEKLSLCLTNAYLRLIPAEIDFTPIPDGWKVVTDRGDAQFSKKQKKAIAGAAAGATVVMNRFWSDDGQEFVRVYLAVGADGAVRGVWMDSRYFDD